MKKGLAAIMHHTKRMVEDLLAEKAVKTCDICGSKADYLDTEVPYCSTCLGDSLISLEMDRGRVQLLS